MVATTWMRVKRLTVLIFVILDSMELTLADKQCKSTVMNVVMKQCSDPGMRSRRDVHNFMLDIKPINENILKPEDVEKGHIIPDPVATIENLETSETAQVSARKWPHHDQRSAAGHRRNRAAQYSMAVSAPLWDFLPRYMSSTVPPLKFYQRLDSRFNRRILPEIYGDDLGFDLTTDEMEELSNELFGRFARRSQLSSEEAKRLFLETAARCCQNEEMCMKEKNIISCV